MAIISIDNSEDDPNDCDSYMDWSVETCNFHIDSEGNGVCEQELQDMRIHTCKSDSGIVLVVNLMIFVE